MDYPQSVRRGNKMGWNPINWVVDEVSGYVSDWKDMITDPWNQPVINESGAINPLGPIPMIFNTAKGDDGKPDLSHLSEDEIQELLKGGLDAFTGGMATLLGDDSPEVNQPLDYGDAMDAYYNESGTIDTMIRQGATREEAIKEGQKAWQKDQTPLDESNKDFKNLDSESKILDFLQGLLSEGVDSSQASLPMESDIGGELNDIQMLAMKVKVLNPQAGQELWNMSNLPKQQIMELYQFRYDVCLATNMQGRRQNYGMGLQRKRAFRKKASKRRSIQSRYA